MLTSDTIRTVFEEVMAEHADDIRSHGTPIGLGVAKREEFDSIEAAFRLGRSAGDAVRRWSPGLREYVYLVPEWPPGNVLRAPSRNIVAIVEPRYRADKVVVITYGCKHHLHPVERGNCYSESRCTECGMHYGVDSSG